MADQPGVTPPGSGWGAEEAEILAVLEKVLYTVEKAVQRLHADRRRAGGVSTPYTGPERRQTYRDRRLDDVLEQVRSANDEMRTVLNPLRRRVVRTRLAAGNRVGGLLTRIKSRDR